MIESYINDHIKVLEQIRDYNEKEIQGIVSLFLHTIYNNNRIYFIGNGGSAADSQHLAAEFSGKHLSKKPLSAVALTSDTSVITAISNDYSFEDVFAIQIEAHVNRNDLVIALSTSGDSLNIVNGVKMARELGAKVVGLTGMNGGRLAPLCDNTIIVPSNHIGHIQESHIIIGHLIYELVCKELLNEA
ncbi:SIS domain-containing protein [Evansella sp. AB-P1]|uniref:D-sedoheptulose-7-phosphate isomerase n=1 Tax=Evansella sp. AB-P1 TaxID=3037653 RepID=UPI00241DF4F4|nr:SIS domain-containing protein [Evansella sp. AB-P1]MDG5788344.1 SIS domain-containing protein [Evansella sp. AB-P1]